MQTEQTGWLNGGCVHLELSQGTSNTSVYGQLAGTHTSSTDIVATMQEIGQHVSIFGLRARGSSMAMRQPVVETLPNATWFGVIADVDIVAPPTNPATSVPSPAPLVQASVISLAEGTGADANEDASM